MPPFRLQYASNLFVDMYEQQFSKLVKPNAPHLALLGNIGRPESPKTYHFLNYCTKYFDTVYWVPGPHELSNPRGGRMTVLEKNKNLYALSKSLPKVSILDSKEAVFHTQRVVLLGTPLWSKVNLPRKGQPEFDSIYTSVDEAGPIPLNNSLRNNLHKEDLRFLRERSLFWSIVHPEVNIIHLTQTLPTPRLYKNQMHPSEQSWARMNMDCVRASMGPPVRAWLGGAAAITACTNEEVLCAVNGLHEYPLKRNQNPNYDAECVLEIEPALPISPSPHRLPSLLLPPLLSSLLERKPILAAL